MIIPGLVSVTFRGKSPAEICSLCEKAALKAVEWGGDVHVPPKSANINEIRRMSADSGLEICAYGSYFRIGDGFGAFMDNLETAAILGAPVMRIWCGRKGSGELSADERRETVDSLLACCKAAEDSGVTIAPEFHGGTLTDSPESVEMLLSETREADNLSFYWQPRWDWPEKDRLRTLSMLLPRLAHAHVFTWRHNPNAERLPLADGREMWEKAIPLLEGSHALLEFVRGDSEEALLLDAGTLIGWCGL